MTQDNAWNFDDSLRVLIGEFGEKIIPDHPLAEYNTMGTGGAARLFMEVDSAEELSRLVAMAARLKIPFFMLGGGSNLLVSDAGYKGLIIKNSIMDLDCDGEQVHSGSGEELQALINFATEKSLTGLEFATGIWGTVGGAIFGNAGAYGDEVGNLLVEAELVDRQGNIRTEKAAYFDFSYRWSKLKNTMEFVTGARFALKKGEKVKIMRRVDEIMAMRAAKLPIGLHSAGCFFKNIPDKTRKFGKLSAGQLLDEIGAKQLRCGDARVFENHANILINDGSAKSDDIKKLSQIMKSKVREKFGIELQEEIIFLGEF
nr:UDP-N-acetylmuramate dehydrogenase [candidate division Zixibacteria bacterium]